MAKHLYVASRKGGVGKTTTVRTLAEGLSRTMKVLLVDFDDQGGLSKRYLEMEDGPEGERSVPPQHPLYTGGDDGMPRRCGAWDVFINGRSVLPYPILPEPYDPDSETMLALLPFQEGEMLTVKSWGSNTPDGADVSEMIRDFFRAPGIDGYFDLVIYDTGPDFASIMRGCLRVATHVLMVSEMEQQSVDSLENMVKHIHREQSTRADGDELRILGLLPTKYRGSKTIHKVFFENLREGGSFAECLMETPFEDRSSFTYRDVRGVMPNSVFSLRPSDPARSCAEAVCAEVTSKLFKN